MNKRNQLNQFSSQGILRCARYAFMTYELKLCTPKSNQDFFAHYQNESTNNGLNLILKEFQTLYPYLEFIARANGVKDPFNEQVVEAYWIGNQLLENITKSELYNHLTDKIELKKRLNIKLLRQVINKIPLGARPHHNFHVLNIGKRTGNLDIMHTLNSMDLCRISWGKIKKIDLPNLEVEYQPLVLENDRLKLGSIISQKVLGEINNSGFIEKPRLGQWISFHWGFACEVLNNRQVANLKKYTEESIRLTNHV